MEGFRFDVLDLMLKGLQEDEPIEDPGQEPGEKQPKVCPHCGGEI